jgi:hypothetical protein
MLGQVHRGSWCGIDVSARQYFAAEDMASSRSVNSGLYSNFGQLVRARVSPSFARGGVCLSLFSSCHCWSTWRHQQVWFTVLSLHLVPLAAAAAATAAAQLNSPGLAARASGTSRASATPTLCASAALSLTPHWLSLSSTSRSYVVCH